MTQQPYHAHRNSSSAAARGDADCVRRAAEPSRAAALSPSAPWIAGRGRNGETRTFCLGAEGSGPVRTWSISVNNRGFVVVDGGKPELQIPQCRASWAPRRRAELGCFKCRFSARLPSDRVKSLLYLASRFDYPGSACLWRVSRDLHKLIVFHLK